MKKKTSSILLLSAFAALVLAGCGDTPAASSSPTESLESSVVESAGGDSVESQGTSESKPETPASSSKSTPTPSSTPAAASSSETPAPSSAPKTWTELGIVGEYKGGFSSLIINADGTTSWDTSTDRFEATCTEVGNGVYHIKSKAGVDDPDKVDVYTDGTMAYVIHDEEALDNYVMDKNALGSAATAFAETEDESKWFGGVEITSGHWKYFANIDGVFHFGVTLTLQSGNNINNGGAIFDLTLGGAKTTFRVTSPAPSNGAFATIEAFNLTVTTYTGDHGDLVVGKTDNGELVYVKLDGNELVGATLTGDVITVRNEDTAETIKKDQGVTAVCETTTYTLAPIARTYATGSGTVEVPLFHALTGTSGTYGAEVGADGNLWATFSSPIGGTMTIQETVAVPDGYNGGPDGYICVYKATPTTNYASTSTTSSTDNCVVADDCSTGLLTRSFDIEPDTTYVIKLGGFKDRAKSYASTGSTNEGEWEEMQWTFTPNTVETYTGDLGDLTIEKKGASIKTIILNGEILSDFSTNGNDITVVAKTVDATDINNVTLTTTTTVITIDKNTLTYTATATPVSTNPFVVIGESDTSFSGVTDNSGNVWVVFTPSTSGLMTLKGTNTGTIYDSYVAIYDLTALNNDLTKLTSTNAIVKEDSELKEVSDVPVVGGHTYVIKYGAYYSRELTIGQTATTSTYIGSEIEFDFSFSDLVPITYTGTEGVLVEWMKGSELHHVTLDGNNLDGAVLNGDTIVIKGTPTYDLTTDPENPTMTGVDTVFTLDAVGGTYAKTNPTVTSSMVTALDDTSTGLSGFLAEDGNLWASFTPTADGYISIQETVQATNGSSHNTLLAVYEKRATGAQWSDYAGYNSSVTPAGSLVALNSVSPYSSGADNGYNPTYVNDLPVEAGKTYIIKIGAYAGNQNYIGNPLSSSNSAWVGSPEAFSFRFDRTIVTTFTGDDGDLVTNVVRGELRSATLSGTALKLSDVVYDDEAGTLSVLGTPEYDTTDNADPIENRTDKAYTLNAEEGTYEVANTPVSEHLFKDIESGTPFNGTTGKDGSYYAKFTAEADGVINIKDTVLANSYDYICVYEMLPTNTVRHYRGTTKGTNNNNSLLGYNSISTANGKTSNFAVEAGKTYIIKVCCYNTSSNYIGETVNTTYQGLQGTIVLTFTPYIDVTADGEAGELVVTTLDGRLVKATLNGAVLDGAILSEDGKTVSVIDGPRLVYSGGTPVYKTVTTSYTINEEGTEYEVNETTEETPLYQGPITEEGTYSFTTAENGLGLIKFVAPADGEYVIKGKIATTDVKLGVYDDEECTHASTTVSGSNPADKTYSGDYETVTISATEGQVFYIKISYWSYFSREIDEVSSGGTYGNAAVEIIVSANGDSTTTDDDDDDYYDDYYDDWDDWYY